MDWKPAPDITKRIDHILASQIFEHIQPRGINAVRSHGSSSRVIARIWSLPRPWQMVLKIRPQYIIEVISERFDKMSRDDQDRTLIHELMHVPKTFSGALVAHRRGFNKKVNDHYSAWRQHSRKP